MNEVIRVGMADYKICRAPQKITTLGLGSCLGVVLYDKEAGLCGLAHVMLPDSTKAISCDNRARYADTCLQDMYDEMIASRANPKKLVAKIAGGASMFSHHQESDILNVGEQNIIASKQKLSELNIPILAEDTGGMKGRTITFSPQTGELFIQALGTGNYVI
ncbi:MAG: chemotaxis protein CheD [Lachnospiraceae bacterium]|nr:chemotaxis protein CheD [Lachnospiraceae bacterium]